LGSDRLAGIFRSLAAGCRLDRAVEAEMRELVTLLATASMCGHGTGLAEFARSALLHYRKELDRCWQ
jgi:formate dehydrogenase iron-sulfur subunit